MKRTETSKMTNQNNQQPQENNQEVTIKVTVYKDAIDAWMGFDTDFLKSAEERARLRRDREKVTFYNSKYDF